MFVHHKGCQCLAYVCSSVSYSSLMDYIFQSFILQGSSLYLRNFSKKNPDSEVLIPRRVKNLWARPMIVPCLWGVCLMLASNDLFQILSSSYTTFLTFAMHVLASFLCIINFILRSQCLLCSGVRTWCLYLFSNARTSIWGIHIYAPSSCAHWSFLEIYTSFWEHLVLHTLTE